MSPSPVLPAILPPVLPTLLAAVCLPLIALLSAATSPAMAADYDEMNADISVSARVDATREQVFSYLLDLQHLEAMVPCIGKWEMSQRTFGEGASAMVRYDIGAMHRRLPVSLSRADAPHRIDLEHLGNLGFITVITLREEAFTAEGETPKTMVTLLTPLNPPPWPFRKYYYDAVQTEWKTCYATTLENLARAVGGRPAPMASPARWEGEADVGGLVDGSR
ncbi:MAG: SRPBCC family protein [Myxococcales bacterium]|nr:SRPBCC family protein [Myxococcales bacterium]